MQEIGDANLLDQKNRRTTWFQSFQEDQPLREALSGLPPRCRRLVQMLFFETPGASILRGGSSSLARRLRAALHCDNACPDLPDLVIAFQQQAELFPM